MIDAHAHLYTPELKDNLDAIVRRFKDAGGTCIINSAIDRETCQHAITLAQNYEIIHPTLGLHPEILIPGTDIYNEAADSEWIKKQIPLLRQLINKHPETVAVGECGLDYYWVKRERLENREEIFELQRKLMVEQIKIALDTGFPLVIHCRDEMGDKQAEADMLELLVKHGDSGIRGLFHSYTGSSSYLEDILNLGFYVSFNGIVTYKNADNVRELLDKTPDDRLIIETDAPFLVPQKRRSAGIKVAEPLFVDEVAEFIAKRRGYSTEKLWSTVTENVRDLFGIIV